MTGAESLEIVVARLDERTSATASDVADIKTHMATKNDQAVTDRQIRDVTAALASERAERVAAVDAEKVARERAVESEKRERVAADKSEADERKVVAARLQTVEDREESRKWYILAAIIVGAVSLAWNIIGGIVNTTLGGG